MGEASVLPEWNVPVCLVGEKMQDPPLHFCQECDHPILVFGRMIPCKHVFCYECAAKWDKKCMRCKDPVSRIERCDLDQIFVCIHGGPRYGSEGCRRTYLSQRDLDAHVAHRHSSAPRLPQPRPTPRHEEVPPSRGNLITIQLQSKT